jgi:peptidoglycan-associated lipoprotein
MTIGGIARARGVLLVAALALLIAGCGSRKKTEKTPSPDVTQTTPDNNGETGRVPEPIDSEPMEIRELQDIHFDFDRYELRAGDREVLTNNGKWLTENSRVRVLIEGHCDERGTVEYNLALGEKRARTARDFLVSYGIAQDRLDIISYGKERPVDPRSTEDAWAKNRRAHFVQR